MRLRKLPNWSEKDQEGGPSGPPSSHTRWYTFMPPRWYAFRLPFTDNVLQKQTALLGIRRGGFLFPWDDLTPKKRVKELIAYRRESAFDGHPKNIFYFFV